MKIAKILVLVGALAMGLALFHGFTKGDLQSEVALIGSIPWGVVSLVDVYCMLGSSCSPAGSSIVNLISGLPWFGSC